MSALPNVMVINGIHADIYKEMSLQQDRIGYFDTHSIANPLLMELKKGADCKYTRT